MYSSDAASNYRKIWMSGNIIINTRGKDKLTKLAGYVYQKVEGHSQLIALNATDCRGYQLY